MKTVIGFSDYGHLGEHSARAAIHKGFKVSKKIEECDIVYISPDRPGDITPDQAVARILPLLKPNAVLVIHCQVEPGFTRKINWPHELLYYHVETLKVSENTMDRALNPERIIVGQALIPMDVRFMEFVLSFGCPIIQMSYESAELAKIAINLYLAAQICTTNTLVEIAKKTGANWNDIIPALQTDKRIGKDAYLKPGNGVGKHLMRDLQTIRKIGYEKSVNIVVPLAFIEHSKHREAL